MGGRGCEEIELWRVRGRESKTDREDFFHSEGKPIVCSLLPLCQSPGTCFAALALGSREAWHGEKGGNHGGDGDALWGSREGTDSSAPMAVLGMCTHWPP